MIKRRHKGNIGGGNTPNKLIKDMEKDRSLDLLFIQGSILTVQFSLL